jgi:hypothetical protein
LYLGSDRGFSFVATNSLSILVYAGFDVGNIVSGYFVRRAVMSGLKPVRARRLALNAGCFFMSCAPIAGFTPWRYLALACIGLTATGAAVFLVTYLTAVQDIDPAHVGATAGMLGGLGNLIYGLLAPWIGRLSDLHQSGAIFLLIGILPWFAYFCIIPVIREQSNAIRS